ncbi:MAG: hypothetical protein GKR93_04840 [Gammaproteobacteria bacterium]|nr:hypothetical protein [Gammaproteobacteria bacterium]
MPRDYKNIKKDTAKTKKESGLSVVLTFLSGLSIGLLVAVIVFFFRDELARSIDLSLPNSSATVQADGGNTQAQTEETIDIPEPTFEFYNILPNKEVDISAWITKPPAVENTPVEEGNYILQVGSFKKLKAADQVKAKLALLGFKAFIEQGVINGEGVFRVRIGPYNSLTKLKSVRERLLDNNLDFMEMRL